MSETYSDVSDGLHNIEDILNSSDDDDEDVSAVFGVQNNKQNDSSNVPGNTLEGTNSLKKIPGTPKTGGDQNIMEDYKAGNNNSSQIPAGGVGSSYSDLLSRRKKQREEEEEAALAERDRQKNKLNSINPLDLIEREEGQLLEQADGRFANFEAELVLKKTKIPLDYNMQYSTLESLSQYLYADFNSTSADSEPRRTTNNYGLPRVVCVSYKKLILVGTSYGMVLSFDNKTNKLVQVIGQFDDYKTLGGVSSLDVSFEGDVLLVGYDKGTLGLFDTYSGTSLKQITAVHSGTILAAKFWKGKDKLISSDSMGQLFRFKISKLLWTYSFDKQLLLKSNPDSPHENIHYIEILQGDQMNSVNNTGNSAILNSTVVALASASSVIIITLEPQVKSLYKIETPTAVRQQSAVPCVSWGKGRTPNSTLDTMSYPILAVGWGPLIQLYQLNKFGLMQIATSDNLVSVGFDILSHVVLDHTVFYLQWISNSMLLLLNSRNEFRVIYTGEMVGGEFQQNDAVKDSLIPTTSFTFGNQKSSPDNDSQSQISESNSVFTQKSTSIINDTGNYSQLPQFPNVKSCYALPSELHFLYLARDINKKPKRTFNNSIVVNKQEVIFISNTSIQRGYLFRWEESINKYVRSKQWTLALKIAQQLNFGKLQSFAELPDRTDPKSKRDFNEFCVNLLMSYLEKEESRISQLKDLSAQTDEVYTLCKICMEYLLEIREYDALFKNTKIYFMRMDRGDIFLALLEPFILQNKLKKIPNEYFNEILSYFIEKKKFRVVQIMIVNLDLSSINLGETIIKCLQYQLFTPLIYINTRKDNDFVAPLYKMYMEYKSSQDDPKQLVPIRKGNNNSVVSSISVGSQYLYRCLWFLRMTLNQKMYPCDTIEEAKFPQAIRSVSSWFFSDMIIIDFAKFDAPVYFDILFLFFTGKVGKILQSNDQLLFKYFLADAQANNKKKKDGVADKLDQPVWYPEYIHEQIVKKIDALLRPSMVASLTLKREYCSFIGRISQLSDISIDLRICQDCVDFLLSDRFFANTEREILKRSSDVLQLIRRLRKQKDVLESLISKIMAPKHDDESEDEENLGDGSNTAKNEQKAMMESVQEMLDNETLAYLSYLVGNVQDAFNFYFKMMQESWIKGNRYKIFHWLGEAFRNPDLAPDQREKLRDEIVQNVEMLVLVSTRYTRTIVTTYIPEIQTKVFEMLMNKPALLLDYLEGLLEDHRDSESNETLALYIALLCKLEPEKVVPELMNNFYPLDEIVELCRINKAFDAVAYICERQGNYTEAIRLYTEIFLEECIKCFGKFTKNKEIISGNNNTSNTNQVLSSLERAEQVKLLESKLSQIISGCTCSSNSGKDEWLPMAISVLSCDSLPAENKNFWQEVALYIETHGQHSEELNEIFSGLIAMLFIEISPHVAIKDIVKLINDYQYQFSFSSLQRAFTQILNTLDREVAFLEEGKQVLLEDFLNQNKKLLSKTTQGNSFAIFCSLPSCGLHLHNYGGSVFTFSCGHVFHQRCLKPVKRRKLQQRGAGDGIVSGNNVALNAAPTYQCPECMKEEIPYLQQIEQELSLVSQKLQNSNMNVPNAGTGGMNQSQQFNSLGGQSQANLLGVPNLEGRISSTMMDNNVTRGSQFMESQKDSQSVITDDKSHIKDFKHEKELFRRKQLKRLQRFDAFIQKDIDNFEEIRQKYMLLS